MKKVIPLLLLVSLIFTSCMGRSKNQNILGTGLDNADIERITVTNNKFAGKYTIIDKKIIERFKNIVLDARDAAVDSKLEPDFTFDFFGETSKIASFRYTAGIDDKGTANLVDDKGRLYNIDTSIEDEFISRLMKKDGNKNVPEYYESLISRIFEKTGVGDGTTVIVDITKDYLVTKSMTSVEQKRMLDNIDRGGVNIKYPGEVDKYDYYIKVDTRKYNDTACKAIVTVTDKNNVKVTYNIEGTYTNDSWSYFIKFK